MRFLLRKCWRLLRVFILAIAALVLAFEEWGWHPLTAWAAKLAKWPPIAHLEARIRYVPPSWALGLFLIPGLLLFPIKLLALWLVHLGHTAIGITVIILAKVGGTALAGRLFILTEPQLVRLDWFARALAWWRRTKALIKTAVETSLWWRKTRRLLRTIRIRLRRRLGAFHRF